MAKRGRKATTAPKDESTVEIGGRSYRLGGADPQLWQRLGGRLDREIRELAGPSGRMDDFKVAVLAALNTSAEHEDDRLEWLTRARRLRQRARSLSDRLERLTAGAAKS